jgi:hypothetical protein
MDLPFDSAQFRFQYGAAIRSGEYVEGIYNCLDCGRGGTCLVYKGAIKDLECGHCDSKNITRTMVQLNL